MAPALSVSAMAMGVLALVAGVNAACSANLAVDNFAQWTSNNNSLGGYTSDDKTMTSTSASGGVLTFTPGSSSYFYENFPCEAATTDGYGALTFSVQGPSSGSFLLEMQTRASCSATTYSSAYYVLQNVTTTARTITIPFGNFTQKTGSPNLNAITSFTFGSFAASGTAWKIGSIAMVCGTGRTRTREVEQAAEEQPAARGQSHLVDSALPDLPALPVPAEEIRATSMLTDLDAQLRARAGATQSIWGQCGGVSWKGPSACVATCHCSTQDQYYAQCVQGTSKTSGRTTTSAHAKSSFPTTTRSTLLSVNLQSSTGQPFSSPFTMPVVSSTTSGGRSTVPSTSTTLSSSQSSSLQTSTAPTNTVLFSSSSTSTTSTATTTTTIETSSSQPAATASAVPSQDSSNPDSPWTIDTPPITISSVPASFSSLASFYSTTTSVNPSTSTSNPATSSSTSTATSSTLSSPTTSTLSRVVSTTQSVPGSTYPESATSPSPIMTSASASPSPPSWSPSSATPSGSSSASLSSASSSTSPAKSSSLPTDTSLITSSPTELLPPVVSPTSSSEAVSSSLVATTTLASESAASSTSFLYNSTSLLHPYTNTSSLSSTATQYPSNTSASSAAPILPPVELSTTETPNTGITTSTPTSSSSFSLNTFSTKIGTKTHITESAMPTATGTCQNLLVDDWESQSRLTFLGYNALLQASSDDGSMKSIIVSNHTVELIPVNGSSYFYTEVPCVNANGYYGGASLRIQAAPGTNFGIQMYSQSTCGGNDDAFSNTVNTSALGWTFDHTMQLFSIPFDLFTGIDPSHLSTIYLESFSGQVTFGPLELYCGSTVQEYVAPTTPVPQFTSYTVAAPSATATPMVLESGSSLGSQDTNALGFWHGADDGLSVTYHTNHMTINSNDSDYGWYTTVSNTCTDMGAFAGSYLHVQYSGSDKFTVAMQQHNQWCDSNKNPYPETWDSLEAGRYGNASDMYFPIDHFKINMTRTAAFALKGFYDFGNPTNVLKIEIVDSVPGGWTVPNKLPSGDLLFACKRPNSFAFAIDDGEPQYAQQVMETVKAAGINVTFFTLGAALEDPTTNLSNVYPAMRALGHQIGMHSFTHPKMEGLPDDASIDWEYNEDVVATSDTFGGFKTRYFRPPFGTEGARMRQRLAMTMGIDDPQIIMWSVDVEDWMWAQTSTPEKQIASFKSDLAKGGNLVVMHYLYPSTVSYLKTFIDLAKATGKQMMRVDQCMMDPDAPPLPGA